MSDAVLLGSLHSTFSLALNFPSVRVDSRHFSIDYRLMFARIEARQRGEDAGDEAAARLSLKGHTVCFSASGRFNFGAGS